MDVLEASTGNAEYLSSQRLQKFIEVCRRVGLPPVSLSPRFANAILPCADTSPADHAFLDFVWSLRGAILGLVPCVRTPRPEGISYRIKFWSRTREGEPRAQHVTAMVNTSFEGESRLHLALTEEHVSPVPVRRTILLIERDPDVAEIEQLIFEKENFQVIWTRDGAEGLRRAQTEQPAAVVLDSEVSGLDGFEVCRRLKADPQTRGIPILFFSGCPDAPRRAQVAGADKILTKPYGIAELGTSITELVGRRD